MTYNEKISLYESVMKEIAKTVKRRLNEEFKAPEKTTAEKLFGMDKRYAKRVAAAEAEYYKEHAQPFISRIKHATTMQDLLNISIDMAADGFKFPVAGMLRGDVDVQNAQLKNIVWMSYDRESTESAESLARLENENNNVTNDYMVYTYYYSWRFWIANIIRCLMFWKDPYSQEANEKIKDYIKNIAPKTPIVR